MPTSQVLKSVLCHQAELCKNIVTEYTSADRRLENNLFEFFATVTRLDMLYLFIAVVTK